MLMSVVYKLIRVLLIQSARVGKQFGKPEWVSTRRCCPCWWRRLCV